MKNPMNNSDKIADIEQSIHPHSGINAIRVDIMTNTVTVDYDKNRYSERDIKNLVTRT